MKINNILFVLLPLMLVFASCDDGDKTYFNPTPTEEGVLNNLAVSNYTLQADKEKEVFETFKWGKFDLGYQAAAKYILQTDINGNNFANPVDLGSTTKLTLNVTQGDMNNAIMTLYKKHEIASETREIFDFRLKITVGTNEINQVAIYSNVVKASFKPYVGAASYPKITVIGDYSGWDWTVSQNLFDFNGKNIYQGWIYFNGKAANGFKLAIPKKDNSGAPQWDDAANWGLDSSQNPEAEASSIKLISSGGSGNIEKVYNQNYYFFKYDVFSLTLAKVNSMQTFGIAGDGANGWDEKPGNDIPFEFDIAKQEFVVTATLKTGDIKFRADNKWDFNYGVTAGKLAQGGDNIKVTAGTYKITVNLNDPDNPTYTMEETTALNSSKITTPMFSQGRKSHSTSMPIPKQ